MVKSGTALARAILTPLLKIDHRDLHRAMNAFLKPLGMAPSKGNSGRDIIKKFSNTIRWKALVQFYKQYEGGKHLKAFISELRTTFKEGKFQS